MKTVSLAALLALNLSAAFAAADIIECANAASDTTLTCRAKSMEAKNQADSLTSSLQSQVQGRTLKETADMTARVNDQISQIYQGAESACQSEVATCRQKCQGGEAAGLASACQKEMGKYQSQMSQGRAETDRGRDGGLLSSGRSASDPNSGRGNGENGGEDEGVARASGGGNGYEGNNSYGSVLPKTQRGSAGSSSGSSSGFGSGFGSAGGGFGSGFGSRGVGGTRAAPEGQRPAKCSDSIVNGGDAECITYNVGQFCADAKNSSCPSCSGASPGSGDLNKLCNQNCIADPTYGPELGDMCRSVVRNRMGGAGGGKGGGGLAGRRMHLPEMNENHENPEAQRAAAARGSRQPASEASMLSSDVGSQYGPAIFKIHSRVLTGKCKAWGMLSCNYLP
jgi:hypothetical protein